ncbi:hypothetical protein GIB67_024755 [Kingdonia uniflora]|uniref:Uncharacterized protein n=1 Tax=Kingdonia uniflora TaxID=39325 RepID=A0A7J7NA65_9MAGN|nr:hypothetical protein GIB67_024755 [Kingdonia uniflora]
MGEESREVLLKNKIVYYEGCPGCKIDQRKETDTGIPYKEFSLTVMIILCTGNLFLGPNSVSCRCTKKWPATLNPSTFIFFCARQAGVRAYAAAG